MRSVQVYKDNLREHMFRTMFFTDSVLFIGFGVLIALAIVLLYQKVFHITNIGFTVSTIFLGELFFSPDRKNACAVVTPLLTRSP